MSLTNNKIIGLKVDIQRKRPCDGVKKVITKNIQHLHITISAYET